MTPEKTRTWWLCRQTLLEMLKDRNYTTDQHQIPLNQFQLKDVSSLKFVCHDINNLPVGIHFIDDEKIGKSSIERVIEYYKSLNINHLILVVSVKMSSACSQIINNSIKVEIFKDEELMFNITKHELVPKHRIVSNEEKLQLFKQLKICDEQMPKILKRDPVCRYLGANSGDVIEIKRKSRTAGFSIYYKIVEDKIIKL